jgi:hypothetical protein
MVTGSFPGVERPGRGVALTTHPIYREGETKSTAIPVLQLWAFVACYRVTFTFTQVMLPPQNRRTQHNLPQH